MLTQVKLETAETTIGFKNHTEVINFTETKGDNTVLDFTSKIAKKCHIVCPSVSSIPKHCSTENKNIKIIQNGVFS